MRFTGLKYLQLLACLGLFACGSAERYDVVIVGGGASGTAAGLQAARMGARTLIVEEFDWLGGMLTNFKTMRTRVDRLNQLKTMQADGTFDMLPKKEVMKHLAEIEKLEKYLGGVKEMKKLPGALFIVDTRKERNAIAEAHKLGIPVVAIADTNCDPDEIDYPIPGNDDAIRAIQFYSELVSAAVLDGMQAEIAAQGLKVDEMVEQAEGAVEAKPAKKRAAKKVKEEKEESVEE